MSRPYYFLILYACFFGFSQDKSFEQNQLYMDNILFEIKRFSKDQKYDSALVYSKKLKTYSLQQKDTVNLQKALFRIAYYNSKLNKPSEALFAFKETLEIALTGNDTALVANLYNNIAILQYRFSDYHTCQNTVVENLKFLKNTKQSYQNQKFKAYSILGNSYKDQKDFTKAIEAFHRAENHTENQRDIFGLNNNIALVHLENKAFNEAIQLYKNQLKNDSIDNYLRLKARILDNLGFAQYKLDPYSGIDNMLSSVKIREVLNDNLGLFASYIHLSKYYLHKDKNLSYTYAEKAHRLSFQSENIESQLEALQLILNSKPDQAFINTYLTLNDSLNTAKTLEQNRYAGLKYDVEQTENENLQLKTKNAEQALIAQKANTQKWIFAISAIAIGIIAFLLWRRYKSEVRSKKTIQEQKDTIEILQKDLHHRVKNNLSVIDAFIEELKDDITDVGLSAKLSELQNRVLSINEVHAQLYKNTDITNIDVKKYVNSIAMNVASTFDRPEIKVEEKISDNLKLNPSKSSLMGLIINEFITNSFKYAFDKEGEIVIQIDDKDNEIDMTLSDNGKGLPEDFDLEIITSYGFRIMKLLTLQLEGTFNFNSDNGLKLHIEFPKT